MNRRRFFEFLGALSVTAVGALFGIEKLETTGSAKPNSFVEKAVERIARAYDDPLNPSYGRMIVTAGLMGGCPFSTLEASANEEDVRKEIARLLRTLPDGAKKIKDRGEEFFKEQGKKLQTALNDGVIARFTQYIELAADHLTETYVDRLTGERRYSYTSLDDVASYSNAEVFPVFSSKRDQTMTRGAPQKGKLENPRP